MASEREARSSEDVGERAAWATIGYLTLCIVVMPVAVAIVLPMAAAESSVVPLLSVVLLSAALPMSLGVLGVYTIFAAR
jgi:hypothetical protein